MGRLALLSGSILAMFVASCGDPPICQSDVFVAIQTSEIVTDVDMAVAGVQGDVDVRTSLAEGETVTLEVLNGDRVIETVEANVEAGGYARFSGVTVSSPSTTLRASIDSMCGVAEDEVTIEVIAGTGCELTMVPLPEIVPAFAPRGVLSTRTDLDAERDGHQLTPTVVTRPGWTVELARVATDADGNPDTSGTGAAVQTATAGPNGIAMFDDTLDDGSYSYRATCNGPGFAIVATPIMLFVDTSPPACRFLHPVPGSTITPAFDTNATTTDGIQLEVVAEVAVDRSASDGEGNDGAGAGDGAGDEEGDDGAGDDVEGEPVDLIVTPANGSPSTFAGSPVDATGRTTIPAMLLPATTPATFQLMLVARDHAQNVCTTVADFDVVYDGCDIAFTAPTAVVTADANATTADGSQVDVELQVSTTCAGRTVTTECGTGPSTRTSTATVPEDGRLALRIDACPTTPCETELVCAASVTTAADVETTATTTIRFDNQGPITHVELASPMVPCNATLTSSVDVDPGMPGVQIVARVVAADTSTRFLDVMGTSGTVRYPAASDVTVTLGPGSNRLVGSALDELGNRGTSATCTITVTP